MKRLLFVSIFLALVLPAVAFAVVGVCIVQQPGVETQCFNENTASQSGVGYDGTAASCANKPGLPTGVTLTFDATTSNPDNVRLCDVRYCCSGQSNTRVAQATALCTNGQAPTSPPSVYSSTATVVCSQTPPTTPTCAVNAAVTAACMCGTIKITSGTCCANGQAILAGQTCPNTGALPTCVVKATPPAGGCICGSIPISAGVCCENGQQAASASACPLIATAPLCGNGVKNDGEQCDGPAYKADGTPNTALCPTSTNSAPQMCTTSCTCVQAVATTCGDHICGPSEQTTCPADCPQPPNSCTPGSGGFLTPTTFTASYNAVTKKIDLTWGTIPAGGCAPTGFMIGRSLTSTSTDVAAKAKPEQIIPSNLGPAATSFTDTTAQTNIGAYIYTLITIYDKGTANMTTHAPTPSTQCPIKDGSFCLDATHPVVCNNYVPTAKPPCPVSQTCAIYNGAAQCITAAKCSTCNGLFEMYPDGSTPITEGVATGTNQVPTTCDAAFSCYKDLGNTAVELYKSCSSINSCAGYRTQTACEKNQCKRSGDCTWRTIDAGTGKGVCGAAQPELVSLSCKDCNAGDGSCDATMCAAIGTAPGATTSLCTYVPTPAEQAQTNTKPPNPDGLSLLPPDGTFGCQPSANVPCELFTTAATCEGGQPYALDATYTSGVRTGGTNTVTTSSKDAASHGKCVWMPTGVCRKEADKDTTADWKQYPPTADQWQYALDFTSPISSVLATPNIIYPGDFSVPFTNTSPVWACFTLKGSNCYPVSQQAITGQHISRYFDPSESGDWELRYYSADDARNIEPVKTFSFTIDGQPPIITIGAIRNDLVKISQALATGAVRSHVVIPFTTSEPSKCSTQLLDLLGTTVSVGARGASNTDLINAYGTSFVVEYPQLADGVFEVAISCTDLSGNNAKKSVTIVADSDPAITNPRPVDLRNPFKNTSMQIAIDTNKPATCRFGEELTPGLSNAALWSVFTEYSETGGTTHRATVQTPDSHRYVFTTVCNTSNGLIRGSSGDFIVFGIDRAGPVTSICDANSNDDCGKVTFGNAATASAYRLKLTCDDLPTDAPAFGCNAKSTSYCIYKDGDAPCTLKVGSVTDTIQGTDTFIIRYQSVDSGGNAEAVREQRIDPKDTTPPRQPLFTVSP